MTDIPRGHFISRISRRRRVVYGLISIIVTASAIWLSDDQARAAFTRDVVIEAKDERAPHLLPAVTERSAYATAEHAEPAFNFARPLLAFPLENCQPAVSGLEINCGPRQALVSDIDLPAAADPMTVADWQVILDGVFGVVVTDRAFSPSDMTLAPPDEFRATNLIWVMIIVVASLLVYFRFFLRSPQSPEAQRATASLFDCDRRMMESLDNSSIGTAAMHRLQHICPNAWNIVVVPSEIPDDPAHVLFSSETRDVSIERIRIDIPAISAYQNAGHYSAFDNVTAFLPASFSGDGQSRRWWCQPVVGNSKINTLVFTGPPPGNRVSDTELSQIKQLATWVASAFSRKVSQQNLYRMAYFDYLTGLPNRQSLVDHLEKEILFSIDNEKIGAVLFMDLDHFKEINDSLGHFAGDQLLQQAGARVMSQIRAGDTIARIGGDEFVVLLPAIQDCSVALDKAKTILGCLLQPFDIGGARHSLTCSIGIAVFPFDGRDAETLLRKADTAMYESKRMGGGRCSWFGELVKTIPAKERTKFVRNRRSGATTGDGETYGAHGYSLSDSGSPHAGHSRT